MIDAKIKFFKVFKILLTLYPNSFYLYFVRLYGKMHSNFFIDVVLLQIDVNNKIYSIVFIFIFF